MKLFETDRLLVRKFFAGDTDNFFLINSNADVMHFIRPVKNKKECDDFLLENINMYRDNSIAGRYAVIEKATGIFVGSFSFLYLSDDVNYHIGYALLPDFWGKGFAQELVKYGIAFFFSSTDKQELFAITDQENMASQNVVLKNGFYAKGVTMEHDKQLDLFCINR
ncbi:anhydro-N-acetylmuramic acid kinase [mine drainage metagenome]|uniref:Anhydro-N-acetylmuramic acid kinase n=1 Tax=mine drainage metagenome TaxID=410659 RepID=A0A1J5RNN6_9ZZZZ